jgi:hypothetical protein
MRGIIELAPPDIFGGWGSSIPLQPTDAEALTVENAMPNNLKLNEVVTFGKKGTIQRLEPFGFDLSEELLSWTIEDMAGFSFAIEGALDPNLRLKITAQPFVDQKKLVQQQFFVYLNGIMVGFCSLTGYQTMEFAVPRSAISTRGCRITFVIPTATSPKTLGLSADRRKLGIALSSVALITAK